MRFVLTLSVACAAVWTTADAAGGKARDFRTNLDTVYSGQLYTPPEAYRAQSPPRSPPRSQAGSSQAGSLSRSGHTSMQRYASPKKSMGERIKGAVSKVGGYQPPQYYPASNRHKGTGRRL
ncbi:unnamed protein product [Aphanomyces euteiches]